jgi:hypothetical protein
MKRKFTHVDDVDVDVDIQYTYENKINAVQYFEIPVPLYA